MLEVIGLKMFPLIRCATCKNIKSVQSLSLKFYSQSAVRVIDLIKAPQSNRPTLVKGWVKALRKMKETAFLDINDGSTNRALQVVVPKDELPADLSFGSSVEVKGPVVVSKNSQVEMVAEELKVIGGCSAGNEYPLAARKNYSDEYLRQYLHFRPRTSKFASLLRIRHSLSLAIHRFFKENGFFFVHTPVLTSNDCEGAGEVFYAVPDNDKMINDMAQAGKPSSEGFFNCQAYLTVSGQLHLEVVARSLSQVYNFGPTFRAENSKSRLHLSEFYMVEAEMAFVEGLEDVIRLAENLLSSVTVMVLNECSEDVQNYRQLNSPNSDDYLQHFVSTPFTIMTFDEAAKILENNSASLKTKFHAQGPLTKDHEHYLVKYNGGRPLFIVNWPKHLKPFYMKTLPQEENTVMAFDLLCPNVGEVCGGSLREDNYHRLKDLLIQQELQDKLHWYLELRKFGNVLTGGFGLGFERFLQVLLAAPNIKDVMPFPRWPHNCKL